MPKKPASQVKKTSLTKVSATSKSRKKPTSQKVQIEVKVVIGSVYSLFKKSCNSIKFQRKFLGLSLLTYILLSIVLVINISAFRRVTSLKSTYIHGVASVGSNLSASLSTLGSLSSTISGSNNGAASVIQFLLFIIFSLVFISAIAEANKGRRLKFAQGIYSSTYSFIQFILVMFCLVIESLPALLAISLYRVVFTNGIASSAGQKVLWIIVCALILTLGIYLLISSIFALFITTLPNMRPWASIRSSWKLVKNRRVLILRKIALMIISLFIALGLVALLLVWLVPAISAWTLLILGLGAVLIIYTYMYSLYKELI
jgi:hypothetical protein